MNKHRKTKSHAKTASHRTHRAHGKTRSTRRQTEESNTFSPMETGQPDATPTADQNNPMGVQGGRGPLNQEGEGERQNSELAELETIEPDIELK